MKEDIMRKTFLFIVMIFTIIFSGCSYDGNIRNIKEDNKTQTSIGANTGKSNSGDDNIKTDNGESLDQTDAKMNSGKTNKETNESEGSDLSKENTDIDKEISPPWSEEKPEYTINLNDYDLKGEKERYLLQVRFTYDVDASERESTDYFVDVDEINQLNAYYEIADIDMIPDELKGSIQDISEDGQKVILLYPSATESIVEIFDIINHKVLYQYKINKEIAGIRSSFNFEYLLLLCSGNDIIVDVGENTQKELNVNVHYISPDGTKTGSFECIDNGKYKFSIYDLLSSKCIGEFKLPIGCDITQWHKSDKILFYTYEGAFFYDVNTKETKLIAPYFYHPIMSPDGKYVAFSRDYDFGILDYTDDLRYEYGLYRQYGYNQGLYVKNMDTSELTQVAPFLLNYNLNHIQTPVQWVYVNKEFDNNKNRWCSPVDKESVYIVDSSSEKDNYDSFNAFDGNTQTAWVEDEENRNKYDKERKYDGKGIGEWVKIYKHTEAEIDNVKMEKDYFIDDYTIGYMDSFCLSGIKIINGYAKSKDTYLANNRVKKAEIILSDGTSYIFDLEDNNLGFQTLNFSKEIETRQVVIKILDIYEGSKYNDTCISEVELIEVNKKK